MSTFNPDSFLNTETTEANDTRYAPIPEGEFSACVKDIKPRTTNSGKAVLDVSWIIDDAGVAEATGMKENTARQSIFLDLTEQGGLDNGKGKNIQLGKLRDALGQNASGKAWRPGMLVGGVARVKIAHRMDGDAVYVDVKGVSKL